MEQYSNLDRVMDSRNHFKNGTSLKIQMSGRELLTWTTPFILAFVVGIFTLTSCDKSEAFNNDDEAEFTRGLWLKMGDNSIVSTSDIDFYDVSTHMIYLKEKLPYLEKVGYERK